jgi:hypothetical protein
MDHSKKNKQLPPANETSDAWRSQKAIAGASEASKVNWKVGRAGKFHF